MFDLKDIQKIDYIKGCNLQSLFSPNIKTSTFLDKLLVNKIISLYYTHKYSHTDRCVIAHKTFMEESNTLKVNYNGSFTIKERKCMRQREPRASLYEGRVC